MAAREISFPFTKIEVPNSQAIDRTTTTNHGPSLFSSTYAYDSRDDNPALGIIAEGGEDHTEPSSAALLKASDKISPIGDDNVFDEEKKYDGPNDGEDNDKENTIENFAIKSMEEGLEIQQQKLGSHHPSVTKSLHSIALEYKNMGQFDKSTMYLKEALELLNDKLNGLSCLSSNTTVATESSSLHDDGDDISRSSYDSSRLGAKSIANQRAARRQVVLILEEKSLLHSCLASIYKDRDMYKEAMENYVNSMNMLVEADYPGDSPRVAMLMRIMKRTEMSRSREMDNETEGIKRWKA